MREIEFRAKVLHSNNWVYGGIMFKYNKKMTDIVPDKFVKCENGYDGSSYRVKPETVGQYTGLKDKNGIKIFEGDIVKATYDGDSLNCYQVIFYNGGFKMKSINCQTIYDYSIHDEHPDFEIIGNIYDNPELLEEQK